MTSTMEAPMSDDRGSDLRRILAMVGYGVGVVFSAGGVAGFLGAHAQAGGGAMSVGGTLALAMIALLGIACLTLLIRAAWRWSQTNQPPSPRQQRLRLVLIGCIVAGVIIGMVMTGADLSGDNDGNLFNSPLPVWLAVLMMLLWGVAMPLLTWVWHRSIDEHEAEAYRDGAVLAGYALLFGAPLWWMLEALGFAPPPDPILLLGGFSVVWTGVWLVRKYG
jgi:hypothetical protein